jgi:hypothetical protein
MVPQQAPVYPSRLMATDPWRHKLSDIPEVSQSLSTLALFLCSLAYQEAKLFRVAPQPLRERPEVLQTQISISLAVLVECMEAT